MSVAGSAHRGVEGWAGAGLAVAAGWVGAPLGLGFLVEAYGLGPKLRLPLGRGKKGAEDWGYCWKLPK